MHFVPLLTEGVDELGSDPTSSTPSVRLRPVGHVRFMLGMLSALDVLAPNFYLPSIAAWQGLGRAADPSRDIGPDATEFSYSH
jgi:hypothetical protein